MTDRDYALAMGEHPKSIAYWQSLEAADDDAVPPEGAMRVPVSRDEE